MKRRSGIVLALLTLGLLAGCAGSGHGRHIDDASNSLVFGYVDMSDAPTSVASASIMQVAPPTEKPYWGTDVRDGLFYTPYLPPGSYKLASLSGSGFFKGDYQYNFPKQGRGDTGVRIAKPGIYFLGSYKYKKVKTGFFEGGKFTIERVKSPSEAELLKRILGEGDIKSSKWAEKIRARLAGLKS